jgi:cytochrome o ubiquinol oxidase subunit 2
MRGIKNKKPIIILVALVAVFLLGFFILRGKNLEVLNPKGIIANKERALMFYAGILAVIVILPVFIMTFTIAWKYREGNKNAKYSPDFDHSLIAETTWWLIPIVIIGILSVITWKSTHELDPFKNISSSKPTLNIQVIALQWKWLFIYPGQNIATVNYIDIPKDVPVSFDITADAPMNSFWVPQLGGQMYAMSGMSTHLSLMADSYGDFNGVSSNISGAGFAGMNFIVHSSSQNDFNNWVKSVKQSSNNLTTSAYNQLAQPSSNNAKIYYGNTQNFLYTGVIEKFMGGTNISTNVEGGA